MISSAVSSLSETQSGQLSAQVLDQHDKPLPDAPISWQSDYPTLIAVDATGRVTAALSFLGQPTPSEVNITATSGTLSAARTIGLVVTGTFDVWPDTNLVYAGMTRALRANLIKTMGGYPGPQRDSVLAGSVEWTTDDASVVLVSSSGTITAVSPGHARIIAKYQSSRADTAEVYVVAPPATPLRFTSISSGLQSVGKSSMPLFGARACGVTTDGSVYCWGGTLDATRITDRCEVIGPGGVQGASIVRYRCSEIPLRLETEVKFSSVVAISRTAPSDRIQRGAAGCGLATTKRVYCWGTNAFGELGIGTTDSETHGVAPIAGTDEFVEIHGSSNVCGIRTDGALRCWGEGIGPSPVTVTSEKAWRTIAENGGCGLASDSTAYCFGTTAQSISGTTRWKSIATSARGVCAIALDDLLFCGSNLERVQTTAQPVARIGTYLNTGFSVDGLRAPSNVCAGTSAGDVLCADAWGAVSLTAKLAAFNGVCGIAADQKVYCAMSPFGGLVVVRGQ